MKRKTNSKELSRKDRFIAAALALIWLVAGLIGLWIYISNFSWLGSVISILAIAYGILWARVAYTSRKLNWGTAARSGKNSNLRQDNNQNE